MTADVVDLGWGPFPADRHRYMVLRCVQLPDGTLRPSHLRRPNVSWPAVVGAVVEAPDPDDATPRTIAGLQPGQQHPPGWGSDTPWLVVSFDVGESTSMSDYTTAGRCRIELIAETDAPLVVTRWLWDRGVRDPIFAGVMLAGDFGEAVVGTRGVGIAGSGGRATVLDRGVARAGARGTACGGSESVAMVSGLGDATVEDSGVAIAAAQGKAVGRDYAVARVGHTGTATVRHFGVAVAANDGRAISRHCGVSRAAGRGVATSGDGGVSVVGDRGHAVTGDSGIAKAGVSGTAQAGVGGVICVDWHGGPGQYGTLFGRIGERCGSGVLQANTPYGVVLDADGIPRWSKAEPAVSP